MCPATCRNGKPCQFKARPKFGGFCGHHQAKCETCVKPKGEDLEEFLRAAEEQLNGLCSHPKCEDLEEFLRAAEEQLEKDELALDEFYWEAAEKEGINKPAVKPDLFDTLRMANGIQIISLQQFEKTEAKMAEIAKDIHKHGKAGFTDLPWQKTLWTKSHLVDSCGFTFSDQSTLLAVRKPIPHTNKKYEIKYLYLNCDTDLPPLRKVADHVFLKTTTRSNKSPAGQFHVNMRGNKAMNKGCDMMVYGSRDVIPTLKGCPSYPGVYNPNGKVDNELNEMVALETDSLTSLERECIPSYAEFRDQLADSLDPIKLHRITPNSSAFSTTITHSYVVSPHDDSGAASETVAFINRFPLPAGHEWLFALGGHVHPLPTRKDQSAIFFLQGNGLYHGTLPTSSTEQTYMHGNIGAALITKSHMVNSLKRQGQRGETTPVNLTASSVYS